MGNLPAYVKRIILISLYQAFSGWLGVFIAAEAMLVGNIYTFYTTVGWLSVLMWEHLSYLSPFNAGEDEM